MGCLEDTYSMHLIMLCLALLIAGCSKSAEPTYQAFTVTVIDDKTRAPIPGAKILAPCMGLSPYRTNIYVTDANGKSRVMYFSNLLAINVLATGYSNSTAAFRTNEIALVRLKRND
jgi:hypothetical protein